MTPLDYIKQGVTESNWELVVQGYALLTGEDLTIPINEDSGEPKVGKKKKKFTKKELKSLPLDFKGRPNLFLDYVEQLENVGKEKVKTADGKIEDFDKVVNPSGRRHSIKRPPAKILKRKCTRCGKMYKISASLVFSSDGLESGTLCNTCCGRG